MSSLNYKEFCRKFLQVKPFNLYDLLEEGKRLIPDWQVAGHSGFLSAEGLKCMKPINIKCAKGRRELLFYQLVKYFNNRELSKNAPKLYYKDFKLFNHPDKTCDCEIDPDTFRSIMNNITIFYQPNHMSLQGDDFGTNQERLDQWFEQAYSDVNNCPCYGTDKRAKEDCSTYYPQDDFLCLEDIKGHCMDSCVMDIKLGRVTYDPMATPEKVREQTEKYPRLRDFGFRILGMKRGRETRDKDYGLSLESQEQVFEAVDIFFSPLDTSERKVAVIGRMLDILERLLEWFETMNNNQLRFYSSSILFVYDQEIGNSQEPSDVICSKLIQSVRVKMIDFAHVFHSHDPPEGPSRSGSETSIATSGALNKDDNYLYGLRRLVKFFIMLNRQYRIKVQREKELAGQNL